MSWFKRKPRLKEPSKPSAPHRTSPATKKMMEEAKKTGPKDSLPSKSK
jgi:hypothetical protein